mgnify:CR=1 FL=1
MDSSGISARMFDKSSLPFCVLRIEHGADGQPTGWKILRCNQALADMTGFSAELMPMSGVRRLRLYSRAAHDKQPVEFDAVSEATGRLLHVHCLPMEQPDLCACIFCDRSTGQPHSRLEVIPTEKLSSVVQTGTWTVRYDRNGKRTSVTRSESFRRILGFSSEADFPNIWEAWFERIHPNDRDAVEKVCADAVSDRSGQSDYSIEYRMRNRAGEYHWFRDVAHISRRPDGTPACLDGILVNVDDRHEANEKLRRALREAEAARNEALIDNEIISAIGRLYFSIDLARDFYEEISSDSSVHRLTGHEGRAQQKMNKLCSGLVDRDYQSAVKRFFDLSTVAERLADTDTIEMEYLAKDGSWQEARFIEKKRGADGKVTHILYVTRIVSSQKQKELEQERLRIAYQAAESANEAKPDFLLSMSHDIRTPMNVIMGFTNIALQHADDPGKMKECLEKIRVSGSNLQELIDDVPDISRIESGEFKIVSQPVKLPELFDFYCQAIAGIGMTPEFMEQMYSAFSRAVDTRVNKVRGSGLGLDIVKKIVDLMGGAIEAESKVGKGTTFRVTLDLPAAADDAETEEHTETAKHSPIIALTANAYHEDIQKCLAAGMNAHLSKPINIDRAVRTIHGR